MRGQAKAEHASLIRKGRRALTQIALAFVFSAVIFLTGGGAQACPDGKHGVRSAGDNQMIAYVLPSATKAATTTAAPGGAKTVFPCGGSSCHCSSGCCSTGNCAMDVSNLALELPERSLDIAVVDPRKASSLKPPPNYRPPQVA